MEGMLERKHKLQLGGKKVRVFLKPAQSANVKPAVSTAHSYLIFTGILQRLELLLRCPT